MTRDLERNQLLEGDHLHNYVQLKK